jgi:hypothetical protein
MPRACPHAARSLAGAFSAYETTRSFFQQPSEIGPGRSRGMFDGVLCRDRFSATAVGGGEAPSHTLGQRTRLSGGGVDDLVCHEPSESRPPRAPIR